MINNLIDAISIKLNSVFGNGKKIYSESIKQKMIEPCFFIKVLNPGQSKLLGRRYSRTHPFDIHYFPAAEGNNNELQGMASDLYEALEYVTLISGSLVHGTEMKHEVVDGVLHFFVHFNMMVILPTTYDDMKTLTTNTGVKG